MSDDPKLRELRAKIDALDEKLQDLISRRARLALDVAKVKQRSGQDNFYRPEREAEVLNKALARNAGPLSDESLARLRRLCAEFFVLHAHFRMHFERALIEPRQIHTRESSHTREGDVSLSVFKCF